eukprot:TRINITY_DN19262_c2_g1_i1.p1 TRINITY_DN19262_c2_g1~~TRINITY_DN19262_c2_g1_i1.p1  ORF type:complete len:346 (+),score=27.67 TRINITY_DN19262_c2_g1_i1:52-1089(+)
MTTPSSPNVTINPKPPKGRAGRGPWHPPANLPRSTMMGATREKSEMQGIYVMQSCLRPFWPGVAKQRSNPLNQPPPEVSRWFQHIRGFVGGLTFRKPWKIFEVPHSQAGQAMGGTSRGCGDIGVSARRARFSTSPPSHRPREVMDIAPSESAFEKLCFDMPVGQGGASRHRPLDFVDSLTNHLKSGQTFCSSNIKVASAVTTHLNPMPAPAKGVEHLSPTHLDLIHLSPTPAPAKGVEHLNPTNRMRKEVNYQLIQLILQPNVHLIQAHVFYNRVRGPSVKNQFFFYLLMEISQSKKLFFQYILSYKFQDDCILLSNSHLQEIEFLFCLLLKIESVQVTFLRQVE